MQNVGQTPGLYEAHPPNDKDKGIIERKPAPERDVHDRPAEKPLAVKEYEEFLASAFEKAAESSSAAESPPGKDGKKKKSPKVWPVLWVEPDTHIAVRSVVKGIV